MFKQNIEYTDFNGDARKEDFYFHLSLPEVTRIEAKLGTSIQKYTENITNEQDFKAMLEFLEDAILTAYGQKTADGRSFHKSPELRSAFENSQAYAELFEMLFTQPELARKFAEGIVDNGKKKAGLKAMESPIASPLA